MKCMFCQKGMAQGVSLFRVNAKGQPGIWACAKHIKQTDAKPDAELAALVRTLEGKPHDQ